MKLLDEIISGLYTSERKVIVYIPQERRWVSKRLQIKKTTLPNPVQPGGMVTYTIEYENVGNKEATNVTITENYPNKRSYLYLLY